MLEKKILNYRQACFSNLGCTLPLKISFASLKTRGLIRNIFFTVLISLLQLQRCFTSRYFRCMIFFPSLFFVWHFEMYFTGSVAELSVFTNLMLGLCMLVFFMLFVLRGLASVPQVEISSSFIFEHVCVIFVCMYCEMSN